MHPQLSKRSQRVRTPGPACRVGVGPRRQRGPRAKPLRLLLQALPSFSKRVCLKLLAMSHQAGGPETQAPERRGDTGRAFRAKEPQPDPASAQEG